MTSTKKIQVNDVQHMVNISVPQVASERLYEEMADIIQDGKITRGNIVGILLSMMQLVDRYPSVHGIQKKAIIIDSLSRFIDEHVSDQQEAMELKLLVNATLPSVIDMFVGLDAKKIRIKVKKGISRLFKFCCN